MSSKINKKLLVAPLDWGLGHATRCVPIIRQLAEKGCEVILAAEGSQASLLQQEFPRNKILPLRGYHVSYPSKKEYFGLKIAAQVPAIFRAVSHENKWLRKIVDEYGIDAVISDNRFGLYHDKIPSVFITHQLAIKSGMNDWVDNFLKKQNRKYIDRFIQCWIPDVQEENNLGGELSHPTSLPSNAKYIGWLSRMEKKELNKEFDIACILSGPEPQRTLLEEKLLKQLETFTGRSILVRGLPNKNNPQIRKSANLQIYDHLSATELNELIQKTRLIICRSGYSSVMDLVKLQQKAVFIPTPGQTEQEYLSQHLMKQQMYLSFAQDEFELDAAIDKANKFPFRIPSFKENISATIDDLLRSI